MYLDLCYVLPIFRAYLAASPEMKAVDHGKRIPNTDNSRLNLNHNEIETLL